MKKVLSALVALVGLSFLLSGCGGAKLSPEVQKTFDDNAKLYTTRNMHYNVSRHQSIVETTNYQTGILVPINSEVTMSAVNSKYITFMHKGQEVILRNNPKYTGVGIGEIAKTYFSSKKVNLSKFTKAEQKAIRLAQVKNGMSKKAVALSLGTPPAHVTTSLEVDQWKFWKSRWSTFFVTFENNKVVANPKTTQRTHGITFH